MLKMTKHIYKQISIFSILMAMLFVIFTKAHSQSPANDKNVKALFVLNFIRYVNWPDAKEGEVIKIGITGNSAIKEALQTMIYNRKENKNYIIETTSLDETNDYRILIVTKEHRLKTEDWVKKYSGKQVLVISEECEKPSSAAINLINVDNKIRFEINMKGAERGGVSISTKLTDMATSVQQ